MIVFPIFTAAEGSAQLTSETAGGTIQLLLARPISRSRIFATKLVTAVIYLVILAGDLNLDIDIDKRRDLFTDDEHLDVETYNYLAQRFSDLTRNTGSTAEPDRRLDYIFTDAKPVKVIRAGPWKGQRVADMDHDPVVADLKFDSIP